MKTHKEIYSDMLIILTWIFAFIITIFTLKDGIIRIILGIPVVLFIPGYVSMTALFPRKDDLGIAERIVLSIVFNIAIVPILGLLLNFSSGITLVPLLVILCIYTITLIIVSIYRRKKLSESVQFSVQFGRLYGTIKDEMDKLKDRGNKILVITLALSIILVICTTVYIIAVPNIGERFTEFYVLNPVDGKAGNYPTTLDVNMHTTLLMGIVNHEHSTISYTLRIELDKNVLASEKLTLNNNDAWEKNMSFTIDKKGKDMKLEFLLFKEDNFTSPYRKLHLWVNTV